MTYIVLSPDKTDVNYSEYWQAKVVTPAKSESNKAASPSQGYMKLPAEMNNADFYLQAVFVPAGKKVKFNRWIFFNRDGSLNRVEYWQGIVGHSDMMLWKTELPGHITSPIDPAWHVPPVRESSATCPRQN